MTANSSNVLMGATAAGFILRHSLVWLGMAAIAYPTLDNYGDMLEAFRWSQEFSLGSPSHPQFYAWIVGLWFALMPNTVISYFALSALNLAVALGGIYALATHFLTPNRAPWGDVAPPSAHAPAAAAPTPLAAGDSAAGGINLLAWYACALSALALPYLALSGKFNANSISLATWPWMAVLLLWMSDGGAPARKRYLCALALGLLSAAAMQGKYYTATVLLGMFVVSLLPQHRHLYRGAAIYLAGGVFVLALLPHLLWLFRHDFPTFEFAASQGRGFHLREFVSFALTPIYYWLLPYLLVLACGYRGSWYRRILTSYRWRNAADTLWWLALTPYLFTLAVGALGLIRLSSPWAIPTGFGFACLWLRNAMDASHASTVADCGKQLRSRFAVVWVAIIVLSAAYHGWRAHHDPTTYLAPRAELARQVMSAWQQQYHHQQPGWLATNREATAIAFFAAPKARALPAMPDALHRAEIPPANWQSSAGIVVCYLLPTDHAPLPPPPQTSQPTPLSECGKDVLSWSAQHQFTARRELFALATAPSIWRQSTPFRAEVFFLMPKSAAAIGNVEEG